MSPYSFTLILEGRELTDDLANRLYDGGCDDALVGIQGGRLYAAFTRGGATIEDAIASARCDVETAGVMVLGVETDEDD